MSKKIIFYIPSIEAAGVEKNLFILTKYLPKQIGKIHIITANKTTNNTQNIEYISPNSNFWDKKKPNIKKYNLYFSIDKKFLVFKSCNFIFPIKHNFYNHIKDFRI